MATVAEDTQSTKPSTTVGKPAPVAEKEPDLHETISRITTSKPATHRDVSGTPRLSRTIQTSDMHKRKQKMETALLKSENTQKQNNN